MKYFVLGTILVHRFDDSYEVLDITASSSHLNIEPAEELSNFTCEDEIPKEKGIYALSCVLEMSPYYDYFGDFDVNIGIIWLEVRKYDDVEEKTYWERFEAEQ